jgi:hypothetical protein
MKRDWTLYFIRPAGAEGPVKIGIALDVEQRFAQLNRISPYPLETAVAIPGSHSLEQNVHDCFADSHSHHEWFNASERLSALIADLRAGVPIHEAVDLTVRTGLVRAPSREKQRRTWLAKRAA